MTANQQLFNIAVRSQAVLEMAKEGSHKGFAAFLKRMDKAIVERLYDAEDIGTRQRLAELLTDVKQIQGDILDEWQEGFLLELEEVALETAEIEAAAFESVTRDFAAARPAAAKIISAYKTNPLGLTDYNGNLILEPFVKNFSAIAQRKVRNTITAGYYQGQTLQDIVKAVHGTTAANFQDGTIAQINRLNRTIVRTGYQHVAHSARDIVHKSNEDIAPFVRWVSTLDSKTSDICKGLDGRVFKVGEGPRPPIHPNCRSRTVAVLKGDELLDPKGVRPSRNYKETDGKLKATKGKAVDASNSYYDWIKTQPRGVQNMLLGPTRAKLLNDGGIDAKEFARLSLNKNFKPISLDAMRRLRPDIFENAGL